MGRTIETAIGIGIVVGAAFVLLVPVIPYVDYNPFEGAESISCYFFQLGGWWIGGTYHFGDYYGTVNGCMSPPLG